MTILLHTIAIYACYSNNYSGVHTCGCTRTSESHPLYIMLGLNDMAHTCLNLLSFYQRHVISAGILAH